MPFLRMIISTRKLNSGETSKLHAMDSFGLGLDLLGVYVGKGSEPSGFNELKQWQKIKKDQKRLKILTNKNFEQNFKCF